MAVANQQPTRAVLWLALSFALWNTNQDGPFSVESKGFIESQKDNHICFVFWRGVPFVELRFSLLLGGCF